MSFNRRHFLVAPVLARMASAQEGAKTGTAVIGVGNRGAYLLRGVMEQPEAKVMALCDIKPDRLDKAATAASRDNPTTYSDWRRIIERKDIDAVFIATPPHLHAEMAIAALESGKHVYCEKPIGVTAEQVGALVKVAKASKKVFTSGQQLRSMSRYSQIVQKIREGVIGDVIMVKAQRHANADLPHDGTSGDWYFDVTKSGGYLIEQSVHNLDMCNWAVGAHPVRACGFGSIVYYKNQPPGRTIFDNGSMTFEYPGGVEMAFTQNVFSPRGLPAGGQLLHVYGSKGAVDLMGSGMMYPLGQGEPVTLAEKTQESPHAHITAFYKCFLEGRPNPADITVGATAALTAILGHEAMVRGKVINWSDLGVEV
jgi:predicted dehydrogenase